MLFATKVEPFTVGTVAGPVVYPRSPLMVVPPTVLVYVLERIEKLAACPRFGVVAAKVSCRGAKINCIKTMSDNIINFFVGKVFKISLF